MGEEKFVARNALNCHSERSRPIFFWHSRSEWPVLSEAEGSACVVEESLFSLPNPSGTWRYEDAV